jgi:hypothetical protein
MNVIRRDDVRDILNFHLYCGTFARCADWISSLPTKSVNLRVAGKCGPHNSKPHKTKTLRDLEMANLFQLITETVV